MSDGVWPSGSSLIELSAVPPRSVVQGGDLVRADSASTVQSNFASYLSDESGLGPGHAETIILPTTEKQVADFLQEMNTGHISVTISGGRTGIVGGAVPQGGSILSLDRMNRIVGIRWDEPSREWRVTAEPGIKLEEFHERIAKKDLNPPADSMSDPNWRDLQRFQKDPHQYFYPPDPTEESASLGGTVATDASGARTYHYGRTRDHVRALRIVLVSGDVLEIRRGQNMVDSSKLVRIRRLDSTEMEFQVPSYESPQVKSSAGYLSRRKMDLIDLFIGSEGTLGVITLVEVAVEVAPEHVAMFFAFFPSEEKAVEFATRIRSMRDSGPSPTLHSVEYFDRNSLNLLRQLKQEGRLEISAKMIQEGSGAILCEFSYEDLAKAIEFLQEPLVKCGSSLEKALIGVDSQGKQQLKELRHAVPEAINKIVSQRKFQVRGMHKIGTDTAVPDEKLEPMIKSYTTQLKNSNLEYYMFGHIAENHLHVNMLPRNEAELGRAENLAEKLTRTAVELGGTVSAEHGIGKMKKSLLKIMFTDAKINQMMAVKRGLDPNFILCPNNIFQN